MSRIFDHRDPSRSRQNGRHFRKLSKQVHRDNSGKLTAGALQGLWINRQEKWVHVDEDRPVTRGHDGLE